MYSDVLIVGGGIAGLSAALHVAEGVKVTVLLKGQDQDCLSYLAQGGVAAAVGAGDGPHQHACDTRQAGHGACAEAAVRVLTAEGPACIEQLMCWGVPFDRDGAGQLALAREGAHSQARILRCQGDKTGSSILKVLVERIRQRPYTVRLDDHFALDLLVEDGRCQGVRVIDRHGRLIHLYARTTVLATGGAGQVYSQTTNPSGATGDGAAMAARAGVELQSMEFVQFHPTALAVGKSPRFLVSEAVRGEGAVLLDGEGRRFLPPGGELGPRDEVARAVYQQQRRGVVYLDATHLGDAFASRFPSIFSECMRRGLDPRIHAIPVTPAAHFMMGGISTDIWGASSLPGLYAVGEVACTGVHGANRLASNSLLESLVFSRRVAEHINERWASIAVSERATGEQHAIPPHSHPKQRAFLQDLMWNKAGVVRQQHQLQQAEATLAQLDFSKGGDYELANLHVVATTIVQGALARPESLGAHHIIQRPEEGSRTNSSVSK